MKRLFLQDSPYTKQARFIAILWTLLIFIGCLTPAPELPHVSVPLIDKWTHFVLFGVFTFLWLCVRPGATTFQLFTLFFISVVLGCFIEVMQGLLTSLGRSMELMDAVADGVGAALGMAVFYIGAHFANKNTPYP
ncbi:MAG: VanZ family protein [Taibaiella sp.]|nr:VanZ family protein [Taibaiella sp.]